MAKTPLIPLLALSVAAQLLVGRLPAFAMTCESYFAAAANPQPPTLIATLERTDLTNEEIIEHLSKRENLRALFAADAGVWERMSVKTHSLQVMEMFDKQATYFEARVRPSLPAGIRWRSLLRLSFALHDIGKPLAVQQGDKSQQHHYTVPLLTASLKEAGFNETEVRISQTLVDNDLLGDYVRGKSSMSETLSEIEAMAKKAGLSSRAYFLLQSLFYACDAASYYYLRGKFFKEEDQRFLPSSQIYENLEAALLGRPVRDLMAEAKGIVPESETKRWARSRFTNPAFHSPDQFRYLVHASTQPDFYEYILAGRTMRSYSQLNMSVIDESHVNTFAGVGVILDVPPENIFGAHPSDMMSSEIRRNRQPVNGSDFITRFKAVHEKYGLPSPEEILSASAHHSGQSEMSHHNEVFATGLGSQGNEIKVQAVFIRTDSLGNPLAPHALIAHVEKLAKTHGLRVIKLGPAQGSVSVRVAIERQSVFSKQPSVVHIQATRDQFKNLLAQAEKLGINLIADDLDFIIPLGVFHGDAFWSHSTATDRDEDFAKKPPVFMLNHFRFLGEEPGL